MVRVVQINPDLFVLKAGNIKTSKIVVQIIFM